MEEIERLFNDLPHVPPERRWRQQLWPALGVITLIRRCHPEAAHDKILLIRRNQPPYAGKWALVGGKVEFGETLAQAARREVEEETGLRVVFLGLRGIVNERLVSESPGDPAGHFLLLVCAVSAPQGTPREQTEGEVAWFSADEIGALHAEAAIIPSDYAMIRQFGAARGGLSYFEAEMVTRYGEPAQASLRRFEEIGLRQ